MDFKVASQQSERYTINTEVYSGPLDLLLQLIEKAELDITRVALAQVTDQYLAYMHALVEQDAAEVSAFLVVAAKLVQIKSSALLPRTISSELPPEEDAGEMLARQLIIYKRFKDLSKNLENREASGLHTYLRLDSSPIFAFPTRLDMSELTLDDLVQAARDVFGSINNLPPLSEVLSQSRVTIRQMISTILDTLRKSGKISFAAVLAEKHDRAEIVVSFLALLELVKRHMVGVNQAILFGEIELQPEGELIALDDQELEFVE